MCVGWPYDSCCCSIPNLHFSSASIFLHLYISSSENASIHENCDYCVYGIGLAEFLHANDVLCAECTLNRTEHISHLNRDAAHRSHISCQLSGLPCDYNKQCLSTPSASELTYAWTENQDRAVRNWSKVLWLLHGIESRKISTERSQL